VVEQPAAAGGRVSAAVSSDPLRCRCVAGWQARSVGGVRLTAVFPPPLLQPADGEVADTGSGKGLGCELVWVFLE